MPRSFVPLALVALAVVALGAGGCSGDEGATAPRIAAVAPPAPGRFLTRVELANQLGNAFHRQLYRLAVMSQPGDDAPDFGQSLPTGTLRDVACDPAAARPADGAWLWSCDVRWESVDARRDTTAYRVSLNPRGCFYASASPALDQRYDATIRAYSEHPLDQLQSLRRGC